TLHIVVRRTIGDPPFKVICDVVYSEYGYIGEFIQNIEIALDNYDPYSTQFDKINFNSWKAARIIENNTKSSGLEIHGNQIKAVKKIVVAYLEDYKGNITRVSRRTGASEDFIRKIRDSGQ
ncbi:unnamed protein product, partial [marine sediment metagenome]